MQEGSVSPELYSDSDGSGSESEELTDDDESYEDDSQEGSDADTDDDFERESSPTTSEVGECEDSNKVLSYSLHYPIVSLIIVISCVSADPV